MSTEPEKQIPITSAWHAALVWVKAQSTETILLVGILCVVTYGLYQGFTSWIPAHIKSLTDAHERVVKEVTEKDERQREADRQLADRQREADQKMIDKLMRVNGFAQGFEVRDVAKRPD